MGWRNGAAGKTAQTVRAAQRTEKIKIANPSGMPTLGKNKAATAVPRLLAICPICTICYPDAR